MRYKVVLAAVLAALGGIDTLCAQSVEGRLLDRSSSEPVRDGLVALADAGGRAVAEVRTDSSGRFLLTTPGPGEYVLRARRIGYKPLDGAQLTLGAGERIHMDVELAAEPVALETVSVEAEARVRHLDRVGFYRRKEMGFGYFVTRDEIERRRPRKVSDLLHGIPGVRLVRADQYRNTYDAVIRGNYLLGRTCLPRIIVNDVSVRSGGSGDLRTSMPLDDVLDPEEIEAIEVHRSTAGLPPQYGGMQSPCGVILIWTRQ